MGGETWGGPPLINPFGDAMVVGPTFGVIFAIIVVWLAISAATGRLAGRRGRDSGLWFLLALFSGPIALTVLLRKPPLPPTRDSDGRLL